MAYDLYASFMLLGGDDRLNKRRNLMRKLNNVYIVCNDRIGFMQVTIEENLFDGLFT
jgi:hypothetical protein